jgi:hypothetical protein
LPTTGETTDMDLTDLDAVNRAPDSREPHVPPPCGLI